jgi:hypothetical protein
MVYPNAIPNATAVATMGLLSFCLLMVCLFGIFLFSQATFAAQTRYFLYKSYKRITGKPESKVEDIQRFGNELSFNVWSANSSDWLIMVILFTDLWQSFAMMSSYAWIANDIKQQSLTCLFQGIGLALADLISATLSATLCILSIAQVLYDYKMGDLNHKLLALFLNYGLGFIATFWMYAAVVPGFPLWGDAGTQAWCFMTSRYAAQRWWNHYFWIFLSVMVIFVGYTFLFWRIHRINEESVANIETKKRFKAVYQKLIAYPSCFSITFVPIVVDRFARFVDRPTPPMFTVVAVCFLALNGFFNAILFIWKRKLFSRLAALLEIHSITPADTSAKTWGPSTSVKSESRTSKHIEAETKITIVATEKFTEV